MNDSSIQLSRSPILLRVLEKFDLRGCNIYLPEGASSLVGGGLRSSRRCNAFHAVASVEAVGIEATTVVGEGHDELGFCFGLESNAKRVVSLGWCR